jgi:hypothetical protein
LPGFDIHPLATQPPCIKARGFPSQPHSCFGFSVDLLVSATCLAYQKGVHSSIDSLTGTKDELWNAFKVAREMKDHE